MRYPKPSGKTQQPPFVRSLRAPPRGASSRFRGPGEPFPRTGHPASACEALSGRPPGGPCLASLGGLGGPPPCLGPVWEAPALGCLRPLPGRPLPDRPPCLGGHCLGSPSQVGGPAGRLIWPLPRAFLRDLQRVTGPRRPFLLGDPPCSKLRPPLKGKVYPQKLPK